ncbi:hypothetical protein CKAN_01738800 [Cinnamomum micranthum f. kanehirae]|uniref:Uncharacterized protein n=1 Tax=Cinnamomum micranthum f. kanehirae TaxID=337451 RepID=A0A443PCC0_9MAGN|nr:hypothetical protein CKAN_01738800 [Cinnamomum micranthum f. kanehirae]
MAPLLPHTPQRKMEQNYSVPVNYNSLFFTLCQTKTIITMPSRDPLPLPSQNAPTIPSSTTPTDHLTLFSLSLSQSPESQGYELTSSSGEEGKTFWRKYAMERNHGCLSMQIIFTCSATYPVAGKDPPSMQTKCTH